MSKEVKGILDMSNDRQNPGQNHGWPETLTDLDLIRLK